MMGGKTTTTTQQQESAPPEWARPALERAGRDALALYNAGTGFNTYRGPTQAPMSAPTLAGLNNMLAATGYQGGPVTNESIGAAVPDIEALMAQIIGSRAGRR